jgi:hypothetical protein
MVFILSTLSTTRKHFGRVLGTLWQSVDNVDSLDSHFKSLAYNIALMEIYKYVVIIE